MSETEKAARTRTWVTFLAAMDLKRQTQQAAENAYRDFKAAKAALEDAEKKHSDAVDTYILARENHEATL